MHVTNLGKGYYCPGCEKYYPGKEPVPEEAASDYVEPGTLIKQIETYTVYACHDGVPEGSNPCTYDEDSFPIYEAIYECGDCGEMYDDFADAVACCK